MANAMRFTTTELSDLESRIANAAGGRWRIELAAFDGWRRCARPCRRNQGERRTASVLDVDGALAELAQEDRDTPARRSMTASPSRSFAGRHPVVEQALKQAGGEGFRRQ
jgi:DNA mismatch repair protein MutS